MTDEPRISDEQLADIRDHPSNWRPGVVRRAAKELIERREADTEQSAAAARVADGLAKVHRWLELAGKEQDTNKGVGIAVVMREVERLEALAKGESF